MTASSKCPNPHEKMNATNSQNTRGNGTSGFRSTKYASTTGIAVYDPNTATSDTMCSQPSCADHTPQCHRGGKPVVSNKLVKNSTIAIYSLRFGARHNATSKLVF